MTVLFSGNVFAEESGDEFEVVENGMTPKVVCKSHVPGKFLITEEKRGGYTYVQDPFNEYCHKVYQTLETTCIRCMVVLKKHAEWNIKHSIPTSGYERRCAYYGNDKCGLIVYHVR